MSQTLKLRHAIGHLEHRLHAAVRDKGTIHIHKQRIRSVGITALTGVAR